MAMNRISMVIYGKDYYDYDWYDIVGCVVNDPIISLKKEDIIQSNKIIKTFSSISEAGRALHINSSNISTVCRGQRNYVGGYKWEYANNNQ